MRRSRPRIVEMLVILLLLTCQGLSAFHVHASPAGSDRTSHASVAPQAAVDSGDEPCSLCWAFQGSHASVSPHGEWGEVATTAWATPLVAPCPATPLVRRGGPSRAPPAC